jgi:hypothetical protein
VITDTDWLQNIVTVYENNLAFSKNLDALFESLQIPDENLGAAGPVPPMQRSLANRLLTLRATGFKALQQNRDAVMFLHLRDRANETKEHDPIAILLESFKSCCSQHKQAIAKDLAIGGTGPAAPRFSSGI